MAVAAQFRQGDVYLIRVECFPSQVVPLAPEDGRAVLATGEVTGHAHAMRADRACRYRDDGSGSTFLRVDGPDPVDLLHEEHDPIAVPPGTYRIVQQREYEPLAAPRAVAD